MNVRRVSAVAPAIALLALSCGSHHAPQELQSTTRDGRLAPLLDNLGDLRRQVTTSSPEAQRFFNQGLTLVYGFNHDEAERSFREAARLDPDCAMAYWGQALALGPNINDPEAAAEREQKAFAAIQQASARKSKASAVEQEMIDALAARYSPHEGKDRKERNAAYAQAMKALHARHPEDPDISTLYADAVLNTMPWDYWDKAGRPRPGVAEAVATLEDVLKRHPRHPGANHIYIHAVEASPDPDRAVAAADRLGGLVPAAGHLVHMPAHIYMRVGRYADASDANIRAIQADEDYITQCRAQGIYPAAYYPHNIHFLSAALAMEGRRKEAMEAAQKVATRHDHATLQEPGFAFGHLLRAIPHLMAVRFGAWDEILNEREPGKDLLFPRAMWHFARGMAFSAKRQLPEAETELAALNTLGKEPSLEELKIFDLNALANLARIGSHVLAGEIAARKKDYKEAAAHLRKAVEEEDSLLYSEPPDWPNPPRQNLGAVLLEAGRPAEAEKVYREDLTRHRDNGWSLLGLIQSLEAQGKTSEAEQARRRFEKAWSRADIQIPSSRL
ncbi:MAG: tetratricopeptide repeat protein [Bryobacteraceae bacterium]|nr:tetratricopeptide repeat protein [Bryobacteraceae bacterium]